MQKQRLFRNPVNELLGVFLVVGADHHDAATLGERNLYVVHVPEQHVVCVNVEVNSIPDLICNLLVLVGVEPGFPAALVAGFECVFHRDV